VVDVQRTSPVFSQLIFNTQCFLIFEDTTISPDLWEQVNISFSGNRALVGPAVYASHLDLCSWYSARNGSNHIVSPFCTTNFTQWTVFSYINGDNNATSHPNGTLPAYYFQTQALHIRFQDESTNDLRAFPGEKIQLGLQGLDQFGLPTYLIARVSDSHANNNLGAFSQSTNNELSFNITNSGEHVRFEPALIPIIPNDRPVDVQYKVPSSPPEEIIAVVDTPYNVIDSNQSLFAINVTSCLPGYELKRRPGGLQSCVCQDSSFSVLDCDDSRSVIFLRVWQVHQSKAEPSPYHLTTISRLAYPFHH
jgi:hypothetical protein